MIHRLKRILFAVLLYLGTDFSVHANLANSQKGDKLIQDTRVQVRSAINPILDQYCGDSCKIIDITINLDEEVADVGDLGFEHIDGSRVQESYFVESVDIEVQIDRKVPEASRDRLKQIIMNHVRHHSGDVNIVWTPIEIPEIGSALSDAERVKDEIERKIETTLQEIIARYCPSQCVINHILIFGSPIGYDDAMKMDPLMVHNSKSMNAFFRVEEGNISILFDSALPEKEKQSILGLMEARTSFLKNLKIEVDETLFPETQVKREKRLDAASKDPYGLEKLRRTLTIFRELAGTKEIISSESQKEGSGLRWFFYILGILLVSAGAGFLILRYTTNRQDTNFLMKNLGIGDEDSGANKSSDGGKKTEYSRDDMNNRLIVSDLKDELRSIFLSAPKVSNETFTRLLQTDGVEHVAKYVHIFGKVIIFELLDNPNMQRSLFELSEFYHRSNFSFSLSEELDLLKTLKNHVTASEIKVMTEKTMDHFEFLRKLDDNQIYNLIADENAQVKGVVITQLSPKNRRNIFGMYNPDERVDLMKDLCHGESMPKEYLMNIAKALHKKVLAKPEFDTQNLRSNEVVLELIEKSALEEQRSLMKNLGETNPDAARTIKGKLVTINMLPYLKDGLLLDLVLGMEREDLLTFLMGSTPEIRDLLLSHAPRELSESWLEDMENMGQVDEDNYKVVEGTLLAKIRNYGVDGTINIQDVNELIFSEEEALSSSDDDQVNQEFEKESIVA